MSYAVFTTGIIATILPIYLIWKLRENRSSLLAKAIASALAALSYSMFVTCSFGVLAIIGVLKNTPEWVQWLMRFSMFSIAIAASCFLFSTFQAIVKMLNGQFPQEK